MQMLGLLLIEKSLNLGRTDDFVFVCCFFFLNSVCISHGLSFAVVLLYMFVTLTKQVCDSFTAFNIFIFNLYISLNRIKFVKSFYWLLLSTVQCKTILIYYSDVLLFVGLECFQSYLFTVSFISLVNFRIRSVEKCA